MAARGLYYMRQRWYDATLGQFISSDPIGFASGSLNNYGYVGGDPINSVDPSGLADEWWRKLNLAQKIGRGGGELARDFLKIVGIDVEVEKSVKMSPKNGRIDAQVSRANKRQNIEQKISNNEKYIRSGDPQLAKYNKATGCTGGAVIATDPAIASEAVVGLQIVKQVAKWVSEGVLVAAILIKGARVAQASTSAERISAGKDLAGDLAGLYIAGKIIARFPVGGPIGIGAAMYVQIAVDYGEAARNDPYLPSPGTLTSVTGGL